MHKWSAPNQNLRWTRFYNEDFVEKKGYPKDVITKTIKYKYKQFSTKLKFGPERCPVYLRLPWIGKASVQLIEQIKRSVNSCFNSIKLRFVLKSNILFPPNFKDSVTTRQKSSLIYRFTCKCDVCYMGHTSQCLEIRINQPDLCLRIHSLYVYHPGDINKWSAAIQCGSIIDNRNRVSKSNPILHSF